MSTKREKIIDLVVSHGGDPYSLAEEAVMWRMSTAAGIVVALILFVALVLK